MTSLNIEICRSYKPNTYQLRIGDIEGSQVSSNITKEQVISEIQIAMEEI